MNMLEALKLAMDTGVKVRPVCWKTGKRHNNYEAVRTLSCVFWNTDVLSPRFFILTSNGQRVSGFYLQDEMEFLGEWEVVDGPG